MDFNDDNSGCLKQISYDSTIFESVLKNISRCKNDTLSEKLTVKEDTPKDMTNSIDMTFEDEDLNEAECRIIAYGLHTKSTENVEAYNPKTNPDKAIDIIFQFPEERKNAKIEIFLETKTGEWSSKINDTEERLSPEQMEQFFKSDFFSKMKEKLQETWPKDDDGTFERLGNCLINKKYKPDCECYRRESEDGEIQDLNEWEIRRRKVQLGTPNERDNRGNKIRSSSGRKLISFSDQGVSKGEEAYYSWPGGTDDKHVFKWSRWCDWKKQKPFVRGRFTYGVSTMNDVIGLSLTPFETDDKNRGFKSFDLSLEPILQYLTPEETQQIMELSVVKKFLKVCLERIEKILEIPDEEIFSRINRPEKCTLEDIRKTKRVFKNTIKALRERRADTFVYD